MSGGAELQYLVLLEEMNPISLILDQAVTEIPYFSCSFFIHTYLQYRKDLSDFNSEAFHFLILFHTLRFT